MLLRRLLAVLLWVITVKPVQSTAWHSVKVLPLRYNLIVLQSGRMPLPLLQLMIQLRMAQLQSVMELVPQLQIPSRLVHSQLPQLKARSPLVRMRPLRLVAHSRWGVWLARQPILLLHLVISRRPLQ